MQLKTKLNLVAFLFVFGSIFTTMMVLIMDQKDSTKMNQDYCIEHGFENFISERETIRCYKGEGLKIEYSEPIPVRKIRTESGKD